jgi:Alpha/beta hydrolase family
MKISGVSCVLVHGSFHGPWCWARLTPLLHETWHIVTPDLNGVDVRHHSQSVAESLRAAAKDKIILIAHSYAGMLVADAIAEAGLAPFLTIFFDAFVPQRGETANSLLGPMAAEMARSGTGDLLPPPAELMGARTEEDRDWLNSRMTTFPVASHEIVSENDATKLHPAAFFRCTDFPGFAGSEARAVEAGWQVRQIDAGHDAMLFQPRALATAIMALV